MDSSVCVESDAVFSGTLTNASARRDIALRPDQPLIVPPHALVRVECGGHALHVHSEAGEQASGAALDIGDGAVVTLHNCRVVVHASAWAAISERGEQTDGRLALEASTAELACAVRRRQPRTCPWLRRRCLRKTRRTFARVLRHSRQPCRRARAHKVLGQVGAAMQCSTTWPHRACHGRWSSAVSRQSYGMPSRPAAAEVATQVVHGRHGCKAGNSLPRAAHWRRRPARRGTRARRRPYLHRRRQCWSTAARSRRGR